MRARALASAESYLRVAPQTTGAAAAWNSVVSLGLRFAVRVDRRGILLARRFAHIFGPRLQTVFYIRHEVPDRLERRVDIVESRFNASHQPLILALAPAP